MSKTFYKLIIFMTLFWLQNAFAANSPPVLDAIATPQTVVLGETLTFTVTATDPENDTLTFSLENKPLGATIDASTGEFSWKPSKAGTFNATAVVTDNGSPSENNKKTFDIIVSAATCPATQSQIPSAECDALVAIYNETGGPDWSDNDTNNWTKTDTPCSWSGVNCSGGHVTSIYQYNNILTGTLPDLSALTYLEYISFSGNNLTEVPNFSNLTALRSISLSDNLLIQVPNFSNLPALTRLSLQYNNLTQVPDFSNLPALTELRLEDNNLTQVPDFSNLSALTELHLDYNKLTQVPDFSNLPALKNLYLSSNQITQAPNFKKLNSLEYLYLSNNKLTSVPDFSNLTALNALYLSGNQLTQAPYFSNLTNLNTLYLDNNQLTSVPDFSNLASLNNLYLSGNQLTQVPDFSNLANLKILKLGSNKFTEIVDFSNLPALEELYYNNNQIIKVNDLVNLTTLNTFDLSGNQLTSVPDFSKLANLKILKLGSNKFTEVFEFTKLPALEELYYNNNQITQVNDLVNFTTLKTLDLSGNQLTQVLDFRNLTTLKSLYLGGNQLTQVPDFSNLTSLTTLSLGYYNNYYSYNYYDSSNKLSNLLTQVPDFSNLTSLENLYLDHNQLTQVPDFSKLTTLKSLYLGGNQLTQIPDFSNLTSLTTLSLGNNTYYYSYYNNTEYNKLTQVPDFSNLTSLENLYLDNNQLTQVPNFSNLTSLRTLNVSNNQLTQVPDFSNLTNLYRLYLWDNKLTQVPDFSNLTSLSSLYLWNNKLTQVPNFSNLTNLYYLGLSRNQLTQVPDFNLKKLRDFRLGYNQLTSVPNFSNLISLRELDLQSNQLTTVPDFKKLISLRKLELQNNPLDPVPDFSHLIGVNVRLGDLSISQTDSPDPVSTGGQITYTLTVKNTDPNEATNIEVIDTLPSETTFISVSGTDWTCNESSGTVICNLASLAVGVANPITIKVTAPNTVGEISNQVDFSYAEYSGSYRVTAKTTIQTPYIPPPVQQQPAEPTEPEKPEKVNNPPTLTNISNQTLKLGETLQTQLNATDPDGNNLTFSLADAPNGASINDGTLTWKADKTGVFSFTVQVTDNGTPAKSDQKTFQVTVNEFEIKLKRIPNKTIEFGETLEVTLTATTDQDDNNFTFSLVDSPDGAAINDGVLTWKADKVGVIKFTVKVTHNGNSDEQTFEVTVTEVKFNLTTLISPINGGSIQIDPNKTNYDPDEQVKLTATVKDAECYEFSHWEGDCSGSECSLIMDADKTVTAHFIGKPIKLNITAKNGKVEPEKSEYLCGDKVELIAKPDENYQFLGWTGYVSTNKNPISLVLKEQENNLTAIFGPTTNLRISPAKVHAKVGDKLTFTATGSSNGNYFWETTQGETFEYEVTEEGIFYIWVTDGKGFAWSLVDSTLLENAVILIRFSEANLNLSVGDKQVIAVKAYDGKANAKNIIGDVILESENPEIAQVMQNGQVIGRGVGTTNLIATYQDKQAKMPVTVTAATRVLQVKPDNIILSEGDNQTVKVYEINQSGTKSLFKDATLNIRNTQIASAKNNVVTGVNKGSTWLDIVSGELSLSVPVIVRFREKLAISPSETTIIKGERVLFLISGGKPPYQIKATNGQILKGASNSRFVYQSDTANNSEVTIIDSLNEKVTARINIHTALDSSPTIARVTSKETVTLQAIGGDNNYFWTATKGQLSSLTDRRVEYTAPAKTGRYTVTIRDGLGNTKDILILVGEELLLSQQQLFLDPEQSIELNILGGEPPYAVEVDAGNAEVIDNNLNYKAPKVAGNYTLTVSDNRNNKVSAEIKVALDLLITPLSSRIDTGETLTLHAAGGFGEKRWVASKGKLDKTNGETVTWTAPDNFGPAIIYVMDAAGATAIANLEVASKGFAVTPSVRHVFPNKNANFTAVGGATPYTWIVEQGDFNAVDDETINYQAGNIRGSYKIEITDNSGKKAQAQVNVYSTKLFASPKILYINKGETLPITIGGGTGNYIVTSQLGKLAENQLKLEQDQRSITTGYTALQSFEGSDTINIFDTAGNLASIKVEIAKKDDIIAIYAGADGKVDEAEMSLAIDDFFAGQAWLDRTIMFEIADQFIGK